LPRSCARHYGFHGTLKPPFRLHKQATEKQLAGSLTRFAAQLRPFNAPPLVLKELSGFLALQCAAASPEIDTLAAACVTALDRFRAPASEAELAKRRAAGLTERQEEMLVRWGYPYVMDSFRFHMTLTCRLPDEAERTAFRKALEPMVARFAAEPLRVEAVALFRQESQGEPFLLARYFPLSK
jgi:2'-5' RNA ligase